MLQVRETLVQILCKMHGLLLHNKSATLKRAKSITLCDYLRLLVGLLEEYGVDHISNLQGCFKHVHEVVEFVTALDLTRTNLSIQIILIRGAGGTQEYRIQCMVLGCYLIIIFKQPL